MSKNSANIGKIKHKLYSVGYAYNRNGKAYLNITLNNKRIREVTPYTFCKENYANIRNYLAARIEELLNPTHSAVKIHSLLEHYFKNKKLSANTMQNYAAAFNKYFPNPNQIFDVQEIKKIATTPQPKMKQNATNIYLTTIQAVFQFAYDSGMISENPISKAIKPKLKYAKPSKPTAEMVNDAIEMQETEYRKLILQIMRWSGMRVNEVAGLTQENIKGEFIEIMGKGMHKRKIPLFDELKPLIEKFVQMDKENNVAIRIGQTLRKANFTTHAIRRYRENELMLNGHNIVLVAQILGHTQKIQQERYIATAEDSELLKEFVSNKSQNMEHQIEQNNTMNQNGIVE